MTTTAKRLTRLASIVVLSTLSAGLLACGAEDQESASEQGVNTQNFGSGDRVGWAYYNGSTLTAKRSFNSSGATNTVQRVTTGRYSVNFPNLGTTGGNVQVTAAGSGSERCTINDWFQVGTTLNVDVGCHTAAGAWADSPFVVSFVKIVTGTASSPDGAYMRMDDLNGGASSAYQGGAIASVVHQGTGLYEVTLTGQHTNSGTVMVTSYGWTNGYCKVNGWNVQNFATHVNVRCYAPGGQLEDNMFTLRFIHNTIDSQFESGGYVWANRPTTTFYTPDLITQYNQVSSECGAVDVQYTNTARRVAAGRYQITYPGQAFQTPPGGAALVTAYGSNSHYCKLTNWEVPADMPSAVRIGTRCFNASGSLVDSQFTQVFFSPKYIVC